MSHQGDGVGGVGWAGFRSGGHICARCPRAGADISGKALTPGIQFIKYVTLSALSNLSSELSNCFSYIVGDATCNCGLCFNLVIVQTPPSWHKIGFFYALNDK